jgi:hypothetical protein
MAVDDVKATTSGILSEMDHPVMFVLAVLLVLIAGQALLLWGATNLDLPGLAGLIKK